MGRSIDQQLLLASSALYGEPKWDVPGFKHSGAEFECKGHELEYDDTTFEREGAESWLPIRCAPGDGLSGINERSLLCSYCGTLLVSCSLQR